MRGGDAVCRRSLHDTVDATTALTVADLLRRVEKRLGGRQEIEWALVGGREVLLCARPAEPAVVPVVVPEGFWERDASHSPRPWTPMLGSVFFDVRDAALRELSATFGLLVETLEFREIGGWEYSRLSRWAGRTARRRPRRCSRCSRGCCPRCDGGSAPASRRCARTWPGRWSTAGTPNDSPISSPAPSR